MESELTIHSARNHHLVRGHHGSQSNHHDSWHRGLELEPGGWAGLGHWKPSAPPKPGAVKYQTYLERSDEWNAAPSGDQQGQAQVEQTGSRVDGARQQNGDRVNSLVVLAGMQELSGQDKKDLLGRLRDAFGPYMGAGGGGGSGGLNNPTRTACPLWCPSPPATTATAPTAPPRTERTAPRRPWVVAQVQQLMRDIMSGNYRPQPNENVTNWGEGGAPPGHEGSGVPPGGGMDPVAQPVDPDRGGGLPLGGDPYGLDRDRQVGRGPGNVDPVPIMNDQ